MNLDGFPTSGGTVSDQSLSKQDDVQFNEIKSTDKMCLVERVLPPPASLVGEVCLYAKTDGKLYFKDSQGRETVLGGGGSTSIWKFSTELSITPNANYMRFNAALPLSVTEIVINALNIDSIDLSPLLSTLTAGDQIFLCNADKTNCKLFSITDNINNVSYFDLTVSLESQNSQNNFPQDGLISTTFYIQNNIFDQTLNTADSVNFASVTTGPLTTGNITPSGFVGTKDIGSQLAKFKDLYLTGDVNCTLVDCAGSVLTGDVVPKTGGRNLGSSVNKYETLYLNGSAYVNRIADTTNVSNITLNPTTIDLQATNVLINGLDITGETSDITTKVQNITATPSITTFTGDIEAAIIKSTNKINTNNLYIGNKDIGFALQNLQGAGGVTTFTGIVKTNQLSDTTNVSKVVLNPTTIDLQATNVLVNGSSLSGDLSGKMDKVAQNNLDMNNFNITGVNSLTTNTITLAGTDLTNKLNVSDGKIQNLENKTFNIEAATVPGLTRFGGDTLFNGDVYTNGVSTPTITTPASASGILNFGVEVININTPNLRPKTNNIELIGLSNQRYQSVYSKDVRTDTLTDATNASKIVMLSNAIDLQSPNVLINGIPAISDLNEKIQNITAVPGITDIAGQLNTSVINVDTIAGNLAGGTSSIELASSGITLGIAGGTQPGTKYPLVFATSNISTAGTITYSTIQDPSNAGWKAFDGIPTTVWNGGVNQYNATTGIYQANVTTEGYFGDFLQIQFPADPTSFLTSYRLQPLFIALEASPQTPTSFKMFSSVNGATWIERDEQIGITWQNSNIEPYQEFPIAPLDPPTPHRYWRIAINVVGMPAQTGKQLCQIQELSFYTADVPLTGGGLAITSANISVDNDLVLNGNTITDVSSIIRDGFSRIDFTSSTIDVKATTGLTMLQGSLAVTGSSINMENGTIFLVNNTTNNLSVGQTGINITGECRTHTIQPISNQIHNIGSPIRQYLNAYLNSITTNMINGLTPVGGVFAQTVTTAMTAATSPATQQMIGTGVGTLSVPANTFKVGDSYHLKCGGIKANGNNTTLLITLKSGAAVLSQTDVIQLDALNGVPWEVELDFTIRQIGGPGVAQVITNGQFTYTDGTNYLGFGFNTINASTFDTTISNTLTMDVTQGTAGDIIDVRQLVLQKVF